MYDQDVLACQKEIRRLRSVVRELECEIEELENPKNKAEAFLNLLFGMLPHQPRSGINDDPGFWTNYDTILCPSSFEAEVVADFIDDILSEFSSTHCTTGYYDPKEDEKSGTVDEVTGFYYVDFS